MKKEDFPFVDFESSGFFERNSLVEALCLHLEKRTPNHFGNLDEYLNLLWVDIVKDFQIDHEMRYVFMDMEEAYSNQNPWEDDIDEIRRAYQNCQGWLKQASEIFQNRVRILYSHLTEKDKYSKHYPNPNWSTSKMIQKSKQVALLGKNVSMDLLDKLFCEIIHEYWAELIINTVLKFIVKTNSIIGFSNGLVCHHLLFKVEPTAMSFHAYPIEDREVNSSLINYEFSLGVLFKYSYESYRKFKKMNLIETLLI